MQRDWCLNDHGHSSEVMQMAKILPVLLALCCTAVFGNSPCKITSLPTSSGHGVASQLSNVAITIGLGQVVVFGDLAVRLSDVTMPSTGGSLTDADERATFGLLDLRAPNFEARQVRLAHGEGKVFKVCNGELTVRLFRYGLRDVAVIASFW